MTEGKPAELPAEMRVIDNFHQLLVRLSATGETQLQPHQAALAMAGGFAESLLALLGAISFKLDGVNHRLGLIAAAITKEK